MRENHGSSLQEPSAVRIGAEPSVFVSGADEFSDGLQQAFAFVLDRRVL
jgi:hypothetical protein